MTDSAKVFEIVWTTFISALSFFPVLLSCRLSKGNCGEKFFLFVFFPPFPSLNFYLSNAHLCRTAVADHTCSLQYPSALLQIISGRWCPGSDCQTTSAPNLIVMDESGHPGIH